MSFVKTQSAELLWETILGELELQIARPSFQAMLRGTVGLSLQDNSLLVATPNSFVTEYLEKRLYPLVQQAAERQVKRPIEVRFQVMLQNGARTLPSGQPLPQTPALQPSPLAGMPLNPKYTFETFIVGKSNQLAHAGAVSAASRPGNGYNPVFLYSGVGLGKTHLLHAVGHRARAQGLKVVYASAEQFTNEFISSIREGRTEEFRLKYRTPHLLMVDDIQFLMGKEQTQEGFFHTFNELHNASGQIVITGDRPPRALARLEDRLRSRFEGGIVADIQPPELETRLAILQAKASQFSVPIPREALEALARKVRRSIRELEGALNRVAAYAALLGRPVTLELVTQALADLQPTKEKGALDPAAVVTLVASHFGVTEETLKGPRRDKRVSLARQVAMFLLREEAQLPLAEVGSLFGRRDHTTVSYACTKVSSLLNLDPRLRQEVLTLREGLSSITEGAA